MDDLTPIEWNAASQQMVRQVVNDSTAWTLEKAVHFLNFGEHVIQADKGSLLKVDKVLPVSGAAFDEQDERVESV